jgi:hypothetical protein
MAIPIGHREFAADVDRSSSPVQIEARELVMLVAAIAATAIVASQRGLAVTN